jgi:uncharacterized SAM-binding protein YcdF (DUF218 family)
MSSGCAEGTRMFFIASKLLGYFCFPLTLTFVLLLLFVRWRKRHERRAWRCFWLGFFLLYFCATPWGADTLIWPLERDYENPLVPAQADVILVLGGALDLARSTPERLEYTQASDRFMFAVDLARQFPQATVIFAGGTASLVDQSKTEASLLRTAAVKLGVAPERIRVDDRSRNTRENATEAKRILDETGGSAIVLLTSAFHMRRALGCLRKAGVEAIPYAADVRNHRDCPDPFAWVPHASRLDDSTAAIREYVGLLVYRLQGYI